MSALEVPGPLSGVVSAKPGGWRLVFVPNIALHLGGSAAGGMVVAAVVGGPLAAVLVVVAAVTGSTLVWVLGLGLLMLAAVVGVVLSAGMVAAEVSAQVRWVEFRPAGTPTHAVIARLWRSSAVPVTDLRSVVVEERVTLGRRTGIQVVVCTADDRVVCAPGVSSPMHRINARDLAGWLSELLGPAGVAVECRTSVERADPTIEHWWTAQQVADRWQVPVQAVPELARQRGVRSQMFSPRAGALYSPGRTVELYDPDDVCASTD